MFKYLIMSFFICISAVHSLEYLKDEVYCFENKDDIYVKATSKYGKFVNTSVKVLYISKDERPKNIQVKFLDKDGYLVCYKSVGSLAGGASFYEIDSLVTFSDDEFVRIHDACIITYKVD